MSYLIRDNTDRIVGEITHRYGLSVRLMLEDIHRKSTPKTPLKEGNLRAHVKKGVLGTSGSIRWGADYAWYQERGYTSGPVKRYTTPGTDKHFAINAVREVVSKSEEYFKKAGL